jgi:hypothetical protein
MIPPPAMMKHVSNDIHKSRINSLNKINWVCLCANDTLRIFPTWKILWYKIWIHGGSLLLVYQLANFTFTTCWDLWLIRGQNPLLENNNRVFTSKYPKTVGSKSSNTVGPRFTNLIRSWRPLVNRNVRKLKSSRDVYWAKVNQQLTPAVILSACRCCQLACS